MQSRRVQFFSLLILKSLVKLAANIRASIRTVIFLQETLVFFALILLTSSPTAAQSPAPTARTPGAPAGSYRLDDFEHVNLFSGNLNFNLPLLNVAGRGELSQSLSLTLETQWDVIGGEIPNGYYQYEFYSKSPSPLSLIGSVRTDGSVTGLGTPCTESGIEWIEHQFNFTYVEPDGTEHMLVDPNYHGYPFMVCGSATASYGRLFKSKSSDFITFVADANVSTNNLAIGYLYFKNGTKSRVENGKILWSRDRNGNTMEFTYDPNYSLPYSYPVLTKIKDSLGREVNIQYGVNDAAPYGLCDRVIYKGVGGQDRIIRISKDWLHNLLRTTQLSDSTTVKTLQQLFSTGNGSMIITNPNQQYDPDRQISAVWLPDGRSYQFKYNVYGRLARVTLPMGGGVEYDFEPPNDSPTGYYDYVVNRLKERRVYVDANNLASKTIFSKTLTSTGFPSGMGGTVVSVEHFDANSNRLTKTRHFFRGAADGLIGFIVPWWNGREIRVLTQTAQRCFAQ
jgi:YD repeat-containing protein